MSCSFPAMAPAKILTSTAPFERRSQSAAILSRALSQGEFLGAMLAILMTILAADGAIAGAADGGAAARADADDAKSAARTRTTGDLREWFVMGVRSR
jgi:hypothetical protein